MLRGIWSSKSVNARVPSPVDVMLSRNSLSTSALSASSLNSILFYGGKKWGLVGCFVRRGELRKGRATYMPKLYRGN